MNRRTIFTLAAVLTGARRTATRGSGCRRSGRGRRRRRGGAEQSPRSRVRPRRRPVRRRGRQRRRLAHAPRAPRACAAWARPVRLPGSTCGAVMLRRVATGLPSAALPDGSFATGPHGIAFHGAGGAYVTIGYGGNPANRTVDFGAAGEQFARLVAREREWPLDPGRGPRQLRGRQRTRRVTRWIPTRTGSWPCRASGDRRRRCERAERGRGRRRRDDPGDLPGRRGEAPDFLGLPPGTLIPMDTVPTSVAQGPDGSFYVGQLTGLSVPGWPREDLPRSGAGRSGGGVRRGIHRHHRPGLRARRLTSRRRDSPGTGCWRRSARTTGPVRSSASPLTARAASSRLAPSLLRAASPSIVTARSTSPTRASSAELARSSASSPDHRPDVHAMVARVGWIKGATVDEQTRGFVAAVLWDLRARCEAQLRWLAESQRSLAHEDDSAVGLPSPRDVEVRVSLERVRQAALDIAAEASASIDRLIASP